MADRPQSPLSYRKAVNNIRRTMAEVPDEIRAENAGWYQEAHQEARELAVIHGIPLRAACHLIAALSPGVRWHTNIRDAWAVATVAVVGDDINSITVSTYGQNKAKAWAIATRAVRGEDFEGILSGPKVTAFARNIEFPEEAVEITVDFHAYSIAAGERFTVKDMPDVRPDIRDLIKRAYQQVGHEFGIHGHQVQAITWVWWRMKHKGRRTKGKV